MTHTARPPLLTDLGAGPEPARLPARRYEAMGLDDAGNIVAVERVLPGLPLFDEAFTAFARGTLISTVAGPVAVEDLLPGTEVITEAHGPMPLRWKGQVDLMPSALRIGGLTRISTDAFGRERPSPDLLLGPSGRVLRQVRSALGGKAFVPAADLEDGISVLCLTPAAPLALFHLAFETQVTIFANGIETESFHPGPSLTGLEAPETIAAFLSLFPGMRAIGDFGRLAYPRLSRGEYDPPRAA